MTMLSPNLCSNEVCYKRTALFVGLDLNYFSYFATKTYVVCTKKKLLVNQLF